MEMGRGDRYMVLWKLHCQCTELQWGKISQWRTNMQTCPCRTTAKNQNKQKQKTKSKTKQWFNGQLDYITNARASSKWEWKSLQCWRHLGVQFIVLLLHLDCKGKRKIKHFSQLTKAIILHPGSGPTMASWFATRNPHGTIPLQL